MPDINLIKIILSKIYRLLWLGFFTFLVTFIVAGTTFFVFAAFIEPEASPGSSSQDFTENILGANNADNAFSSDLVTASSTGSIIERLEYVQSVKMERPDYAAMKYQAYDDYNCNGGDDGNNGIYTAACLAADPEYTGEEAVWATSSDATPGSQLVATALVGRDMRTGLYWSDCYDSSTSQDNACNTITNSFDDAINLCTADEINGGACSINDRDTTSDAINTFCKNLSLDADGDTVDETDWRLPTQKEFLQAYIDGAANNLPHPDQYFWSATEYYSAPAYAWLVYLSYGGTYYYPKGYPLYARCVR